MRHLDTDMEVNNLYHNTDVHHHKDMEALLLKDSLALQATLQTLIKMLPWLIAILVIHLRSLCKTLTQSKTISSVISVALKLHFTVSSYSIANYANLTCVEIAEARDSDD